MTLDITIQSPTLSAIASARELMENHLEEVKRVTDSVRAWHAKEALQQQFPDHTVAVFARTWETDEHYLMQLLSSADGIADINFDEHDTSALTSEQKGAVSTAEGAIRAIGSDGDIWEHLDMPDEEHEGWYEFDLTLDDASDLTDTPVPAAENLSTKDIQ